MLQRELLAGSNTLSRAAKLLLPAYRHSGEVLWAPLDRSERLPTADACVLVFPPSQDGSLSHLRTRRHFISAAKRFGGDDYEVKGVHHVPPLTLSSGLRARAAGWLAGGAIVELHRRDDVTRVLDTVFDEAAGGGKIRFTSSGGIIADYGARHIIRITADESPNTWALRTAVGRPKVPRLVAWGHEGGAYWAIESKMPGRRARRMTRRLTPDVVAFCAILPRQEVPALAPKEDLEELRLYFPHHMSAWAVLELRLAADALPWSIARHGDLWTGNLRTHRGRLTGVVDWDGWHAFGVPGADVLHALAFRPNVPIGSTVTTRPWLRAEFREITRVYWGSLQQEITDGLLECAGIAWWVGYLAASVRRQPALARDERWIHDNITSPIATFA